MKVFNKENGEQVLYVQLRDIDFLLHSDIYVPKSVYMVVLDDEVPINKHKSRDYYAFRDKENIEFLSGLDFIVDYKKYRNLEAGEIGVIISDIDNAILDAENAFDTLTPEERKNNSTYFYRIQRLDYKKKTLMEIANAKMGKGRVVLPDVPDSDSFSLTSDSEYQISQSIDHEKVLLYRKDGKTLTEDEKVPEALIQMALSIALADKRDEGLEADSVETIRRYSEDGKYLIVSFDVKPPKVVKEKSEDTSNLVNRLKKALGI